MTQALLAMLAAVIPLGSQSLLAVHPLEPVTPSFRFPTQRAAVWQVPRCVLSFVVVALAMECSAGSARNGKKVQNAQPDRDPAPRHLRLTNTLPSNNEAADHHQ